MFYDEAGKHWHEALTRERWHAVGSLVRREARRLNFAAADEKIANVDGATRIRNQLEAKPHELPLDGLGLDFYHLAENVHKSRRIVFGDSDEGRAWADKLPHTLKHEDYEPAWEELLAWRRRCLSDLTADFVLRRRIVRERIRENTRCVRRPLHDPTKKAEADRLINYVMERREMINYPEFIKRGWQIGSGPTESRCKTSTFRLKGRGRRWNMSNAEAVAALTTMKDSRQWDLFWITPANAKT